MRMNLCDKCGKEISSKKGYFKVLSITRKKPSYCSYVHKQVASLCLKCWEKAK